MSLPDRAYRVALVHASGVPPYVYVVIAPDAETAIRLCIDTRGEPGRWRLESCNPIRADGVVVRGDVK